MTLYCLHIRFTASGRPSGKRRHLLHPSQFSDCRLITTELRFSSAGATGTTIFDVASYINKII
jgi:hypothetical protein